MINLLLQASRFGLVGLAATAIHYLLALTFIHLDIPPLLANIGAFAAAFWISYLGHAHWSFFDQGHGGQATLRRFLIVSCCGFLLNETLLAILIVFSPLTIELALMVVLIVTAGTTFFLSKIWAFRPAGGS